jgi:hypothetical protein
MSKKTLSSNSKKSYSKPSFTELGDVKKMTKGSSDRYSDKEPGMHAAVRRPEQIALPQRTIK